MNKAELIDVLTEKLGSDRRQATAAVENVVDTIVRAVHKGDSVTITGFGVFEQRRRAARVARNPRTGETVKVKPTSVPAFRPGAQFKAVVSGAQRLPAEGPAVKRGVTAGGAREGAVKKAVRKAVKKAVRKAAAKKAVKQGRSQEGRQADRSQEGREARPQSRRPSSETAAKKAVKQGRSQEGRASKTASQEGRASTAAVKKAARKGSGQERPSVSSTSGTPWVTATRGVPVCREIG